MSTTRSTNQRGRGVDRQQYSVTSFAAHAASASASHASVAAHAVGHVLLVSIVDDDQTGQSNSDDELREQQQKDEQADVGDVRSSTVLFFDFAPRLCCFILLTYSMDTPDKMFTSSSLYLRICQPEKPKHTGRSSCARVPTRAQFTGMTFICVRDARHRSSTDRLTC